jgi:2-polyprenyl-6-methoxyphenol hydroxylase-like FAD-dependent oxidoreductase
MAITQEHSARQDRDLDVLIVGAGPTGLTLAAQLRTFGIRFRLIDRAWDRGHESRALAVQARTLELLDSIGLAEPLVARGNPSARVVIHIEGRVAEMQLSDFAARDTRDAIRLGEWRVRPRAPAGARPRDAEQPCSTR